MKIAALSDTHGAHKFIQKYPEADIFVYAGDISCHGNLKEITSFVEWYKRLPYKKKILIAGNHDWALYHDRNLGPCLFNEPGRSYYLDNSHIEIEGINFYGSPFTPEFSKWAFMLDEDKLVRIWQHIPRPCDVLITHGPPLAIQDKTFDGRAAGSGSLLDRILHLKPQLHIFGHIHEARGQQTFHETHFANVSYDPEVKEITVLEI